MAQPQAVWTTDSGEEARPDSRLIVHFYMEAEQNEEKSNEQGRPVYEDKEYIRIMVPGDATNIIARPIRPIDKQQFAQQYAAFKEGRDAPQSGTPLDKLPFLTKGQVLEFAAVNIHTAEQVRDMSDQLGQKFMGIHSVKKRITDFLLAAEGNAPVTKMRAELEKRDAALAESNAKMAVLEKALEDMARKIEAKGK